jgi:hypothetical protein
MGNCGTVVLHDIHLDDKSLHCWFSEHIPSPSTLLTPLQLIYYTRLPLGRNSMFGLKAAAGTLAITWVICMLASLEECQPLSLAWQVSPHAPKCAVSGTFNLVSDNFLTHIHRQL